MVGEILSHYKILEKLGAGGMGEVYKAQDLKLDRLVALKFLPSHLSCEKEAVERFIREAKAVSALDHINVCTIYEIEETTNGRLFIAMACYSGETLKSKINKGQLAIEEAIEITVQSARGLAAAHAAGIIHRDVKPGNLIITEDHIVKIVDFGLAKLAGNVQITGSETILGTAGYMSPEQLRGETADQRSDIWSLGVVLYEMLTGQPPFKGKYPQAVFYQILNEEPPPVSSLRPEIPTELENIVVRTIRKNPDERYRHIEDMLQDLLALQLIPAPMPAGQSPEKRLSQGKSKFRLIVLGLIMLFIIAGGIYLRKYFLPETGERTTSESYYRIAVLPFKNISPDSQDEYFADGMTEELISTLSRIKELRVIAHTSVMQYKGIPKRVSEIRSELKVNSIMRGSVRKFGSQVRITVQLVDATSEANLWSQEYDREFKDIFSVQSDIARNVAQTLQIHLKDKEENRLAETATGNLEAYELYLKGRYYLNKRTPSFIHKGMEHFQAAIAKDSSLVLAYTGLADAYSLLGSTEYGVMPPNIARPRAKEAVLKALRLDDASAEAHLSLANILLFYDWNWPEAEEHFQRAIALNSNDVAAHHWYALYFISLGKADAAFEELHIAHSLDPISPLINLDLGWTHYYFRQYDLAIQQLRETLELDEYFILAHIALAFTYDLQMRHSEALAAIEKAQELAGDYPLVTAARGYILARAGRKAEANALLQELLPLAEGRNTYLPSLFIAMVYLGLEDREGAFRWIEKAYQERCNYLLYFKVDPKLDPLRSDPRFIQLMKKIGFKD